MLRVLGWGFYILVLLVLTALSQVGGAVLVFSTLVVWSIFPSGRLGWFKGFFTHLIAFSLVYGAIAALLVPPVARIYGRVPLPCVANETATYGALNPLTCVLNRNYAVPEVAAALTRMAEHMSNVHENSVVGYLDAGFPFFEHFPLLPHITHRTGRDLDLAYFYTDEEGRYLPGKARSPIGYWGFVQPLAGARQSCADAQKGLSLRWNMTWLQPLLKPYRLDEARTGELLRWLVQEGGEHGVKGVIIEPHVSEQLGVHSQLIRFQGCRAARHDDHIHVDFD